MKTTTDFEQWIENSSIEDEETREALIEAIKNENSNSPFDIKKKDGQMFVKYFGADKILRLASIKAKKAFLHYVERLEIEEEDELEEGYRRNMENPRA